MLSERPGGGSAPEVPENDFARTKADSAPTEQDLAEAARLTQEIVGAYEEGSIDRLADAVHDLPEVYAGNTPLPGKAIAELIRTVDRKAKAGDLRGAYAALIQIPSGGGFDFKGHVSEMTGVSREAYAKFLRGGLEDK